MVLLRKYKVYCLVEELYYYEWNTSFPLVCPEDGEAIAGETDDRSAVEGTLSFGKIRNITHIDSPFTPNQFNLILWVDTSGGTTHITLPPSNSVDGLSFHIRKTTAINSLIIFPDGAELVDGAISKTLTAINSVITVTATDGNWSIDTNIVSNISSNTEDPLDSVIIGSAATAIVSTVQADPHLITVSMEDSDYTSIAKAVNNILDSSATNRYLIKVDPGIYTEPLIDLSNKPYVSIMGASINTTVIQPAANNHHVFKLGLVNEISFCWVRNAGTGYAAFAAIDSGDFCTIHKVSIYDCDIGFLVRSSTVDTLFYCEYVDINGSFSYGIKVENLGSAQTYCSIENYFPFVNSGTSIGSHVSGANGVLEIAGATFTGNSSGTAAVVTNGAYLRMTSVNIEGWATGISVPSGGSGGDIISCLSLNFDSNTTDINIQEPTASGTVQGFIDREKTVINDSSTVNVKNIDLNKINVAKRGGDYTTINAALDAITDASISNQYLVQIGTGIFVEPTITMKPYVSLRGSGSTVTFIVASTSNMDLIIAADSSSISELHLSGSTGTGYCAVKYASTSTDISVSFTNIEHIIFGENNVLVKSIGTEDVTSIIHAANIKFGDDVFVNGFVATTDNTGGAGIIHIRNSASVAGGIVAGISILAKADKPNCEIIANSFHAVRNGLPGSSIAFCIENGAKLKLASVHLEGWNKAIYSPNGGSAPSIIITGFSSENNNTDIQIDHTLATGNIITTSPYSKIQINDTCTVSVVDKTFVNIVVAKKGGDFTTISSAIASITDASATKKYTITIRPGIYVEPLLDLSSKPYVSVKGEQIQSVVIKPDDVDHHIFKLGEYNELMFMTLQDAGTGFAGIYCTDANYGQCHKVSFLDCDTGIFVESDVVDTYFYGEYVDMNGIFTYAVKIISSTTNVAYISLENYFVLPTSDTPASIGTYISGTNAKADIRTNVQGYNSSGIGIKMDNGAYVTANASNISGVDTAILVDNVGAASTLYSNGTILLANTLDIDIQHTSTLGTFTGNATSSKINSASSSFNWQYLDSVGGELEIKKNINVTFSDGTHTDISSLIYQSSAMGLIDGGELSTGSGFVVNVAAGYGYLNSDHANSIINKITWSSSTITLTANVNKYIYFNSSNILSSSTSIPDIEANIILGRVCTNGTSIEFIDLSPIVAHHAPTHSISYSRDAFGPVYDSGSIVTNNVTAFHINISSGVYYYSNRKISPTGGTNVTFTQYYQDGSGGWTRSSTNVVNSSNYDNGTGTLADLTSSYYTKHSLYVVGEGSLEKYFLVLGQEQYLTLVNAEGGTIPTPPSFFSDGVVLIANIIVRQGGADITEILDSRPIIGFKASGVSATATHANLLGLSADDHTQYLLANGSRAMSGALNMGNNNITNAGTINSISISAHASRHLPNGADPLTTGAPSTIGTSNATGTANAFARQDHVHSHGAQTDPTHHAVATQSTHGFMSSSDKTKLDNTTRDIEASTGVITNGLITLGTSNDKFSISNGTGDINDNITSHTITRVTWTGLTEITVTNIASADFTYIAINSSGSVVQQTTPFTNTQSRSNIVIGFLEHPNRTSITGINSLQTTTLSPLNQLGDFSNNMGVQNVSGNIFSANGANLFLDKSSGTIFKTGCNWETDNRNPNQKSLSSQTAISTLYYKTFAGTYSTTSLGIDPNNYDPAGAGIASVPSNQFTVQRIFIMPSGNVFVLYGQYAYSSFALAQSSIDNDIFQIPSELVNNALLRCLLIVKQGTSALNSTNNARFLQVPANGSVIGMSSLLVSDLGTFATQSSLAHSSLTGLTSGDDHTQYALLDGRSGGQTVAGSTLTTQNLTLRANNADLTTGSVIIPTTTTSSSSSTGALRVAGGVGITENLYVGGLINGTINTATQGTINHNSLANLATGDVHTQYTLLAGRSGGQTIAGSTLTAQNLTLRANNANTTTGSVIITTTTASSSTSTGALRVSGGTGITGNLYVGGTINGTINTATQATINHNSLANLATGDVHTQYTLLAGRSGGQTISGSTLTAQNLTLRANAADLTGSVTILTATSSTSSSTGALLVTGGVGITQNLYVGGTINGTINTATQGTIDHNSLANLTTGDVHTQYALIDGRSGGQTLSGSNTAGQNFTLKANSSDLNGQILITTTTTSSSSSTGALQVAGGVGITGSLYVGGTINGTINTATQGIINHNSLANLSTGDVHIQYTLLAGRSGGQTIAGSTLTNQNMTLRANNADLTTGAIIISTTTASSSSSTGALQVAGGVGVSGSLYVGGTINGTINTATQGTIDHNSLANLATGDVHTQYTLLAGRSGGQTIAGSTVTAQNLTLRANTANLTTGQILITTTTTSTSTSTGALQVAGGVGITENLYVGGTINGTINTATQATINHNSLANLATGDVHTQYTLLAGRSGGQTVAGSTVTAQNLTLRANTADLTSGGILITTTTATTAAATGALQVSGGIYTANNIFAIGTITTGNILLNTNTISSTNTNGNIQFSPNGTGNVYITSTVDATAITTASIRTDGGLAVTKAIKTNSFIELADISAPTNPGASLGRVYKKTGDRGLFWKPNASDPEAFLSFGSNYIYVESLGTSSTTSSSYVTLLTSNAVTFVAGTYYIAYSYMWSTSSTGREFYGRITVDGVEQFKHVARPFYLFNVEPFCGFRATTFTAGTHTITLDYAADPGGSTSSISNATLLIYRIA